MTESRPIEATLQEVRHNPFVTALAASPIALALAILADFVHVRHAAVPAIDLGVLGVVFSLFAWRRNFRPLVREARVRAGREGVTIGGRHIPRANIRAGFVVPDVPPRVRLERPFGRWVDLQVSDPDEGRALLRALGFDVSQAVATFSTSSRVLARRRYGLVLGLSIGFAYLGFLTTVGRGHGPSLLPALVLGAMVLVGLGTSLVPSRLHVGADGVSLSWLWQDRFLGYDEIDVVTRYERGFGRSRVHGLSIVLRSGEEVLVPITSGSWADMTKLAMIQERIREAMEGFHAGGSAADAALLRRGDRPLAAWVSALRALGAGANADLRTAPVPRERLFRIVEDPACAPADRAAAAVALGSDLDDDGRRRLEAAAGTTAAPRLRVVIEKAAATPDPAELEAALAALEEDAPEVRARA